MMRMILCTAAAISLLASCDRKKTITCEDMHYVLKTVGYTMSDVDTLEVRWFSRGSNFTKPIDTLVLRNTGNFVVKGDTITLTEKDINTQPFKGTHPYNYYHDVEVYLPAAKRGFRISNIQHANRHTMEADGMTDIGCVNDLVSYTLDGSAIVFGTQLPNIYLKK